MRKIHLPGHDGCYEDSKVKVSCPLETCRQLDSPKGRKENP